MIRFLDASNKTRNLESSSSVSGYKEIKPAGNVIPGEADDFWNKMFSSEIKEKKEGDIDSYISEIYGRDEEFSFDIDLKDDEIQNALNLFKPENWNMLSENERLSVIHDLEKNCK